MFRSPMRSSSGSFYFLVEVTEFKFTKNVKDPLWLCGIIRLICLHCVLGGLVSWTNSQLHAVGNAGIPDVCCHITTIGP